MWSLGSKSSLKMAWGSCGKKKRGTCMAYGVRIECWGDYACFTRPEMKVERVSYDVMTPSAASGPRADGSDLLASGTSVCHRRDRCHESDPDDECQKK